MHAASGMIVGGMLAVLGSLRSWTTDTRCLEQPARDLSAASLKLTACLLCCPQASNTVRVMHNGAIIPVELLEFEDYVPELVFGRLVPNPAQDHPDQQEVSPDSPTSPAAADA